MTDQNNRILVIEDEIEIARLVSLHLEDAGYEVEVSNDGLEALRRAMVPQWALIVLDLALPGIDGLEICRRLRSVSDMTPILMLTARSSELDRVVGLEIGADDYLTKPFSILELTARVKALFRRMEAFGQCADSAEGADTRAFEVGDFEIDPGRRCVKRCGCDLTLTAREFDLLLYLSRHPGRVFSRAELLDRVWGYGHDGYEHTVNSHINRLRAKLEQDPRQPDYVMTVWGVGYKLADPPTRRTAGTRALRLNSLERA
jgi:DNA-binding response OmpR family regulator